MNKYSYFGDRVKVEREKRGWDQQTLASAMAVKQQTVSRWEAGNSRPNQDAVYMLAEIFETDADEWLGAAGYDLQKPVRPLTATLPLRRLSPTRFELFSKDFIGAVTGVHAYLYGTQGSKQDGIDLYADTPEGRKTYQCKRHQQFGQKDVENTITANTFDAVHHYLLLTRPATTGARDVITKYENWSLWDVVDISSMIRALPKDDALRIVDTYFPGHRRDFLGEPEPSPWLTPEQVYHPDTISRSKLFGHGWGFVGRKRELQAIEGFAAGAKPKALILSGIGGVGKSRLLRAWSERVAGQIKVLFLLPGVEVRPSDFDLLPKHGIVVIDDAHERNDLATLFTEITRLLPNIRILLSTRPYGLTRIRDDLSRTNVAFDYDGTIVLGDLSVDEAQELAEEVMREIGADVEHARRIADITKDCPLATVIGSRLVAEGKIKPNLLNNSEEFRTHLFSRFRTIITGEIGGNARGADDVRSLLDLIATVQPVDDTTPMFQKAAAEILERRWSMIARDIRSFEDAGVLVRRSGRIRVVPDLLADFIRADVTYDNHLKSPTGYADEVYRIVDEDLAVNLLVNLSQLDWRLSVDGAQSQILDKVWAELEDQFRQAKIFGRESMLKALQKVAYYQPARALIFAKMALSDPTDAVEDGKSHYGLRLYKPSYGNVISEVAPLLKYVAYNMESLGEALDILHQLAKKDRRPSNQYPDHPMRIIRDIASIAPGKPLQYNEQVLDQAIAWLKDDYGNETVAFEVFKTLLATEGHETELQGISLSLKPYKVRAEAVAGLRNRIIDAVFEMIQGTYLSQAVRAIEVLQTALSGPVGIGAMEVTAEDQASWEPGILDVLNRLKLVVAEPKSNPFVVLEVRGAVAWYARRGAPSIRQAARAVIDNIPTTLDYELARALVDGWGWSFEHEEGWTGKENEVLNNWRQTVAKALLEQYPVTYKAIEKLEGLVAQGANLPLSQQADCGPFIATVIKLSTQFGETLGDYIVAHQSSPLAVVFGVAITVLMEADSDRAIQLAKAGAESGNEQLEHSVSSALGWKLFSSVITVDEAAIVKALAKSKSVAVRATIPRAVRRFTEQDKAMALDILLSIDFSDSESVADEVLAEIDQPHGRFKVEDLSADQVKNILINLVALDSIDKYHISRFLARTSYLYPELTLQLFFDRVNKKEQQGHEGFDLKYKPIPYMWHNDEPFRFHETAEYEHLLRRVRDWASIDTKDWIRSHFGADIFKLVSAGYDAATLKVLEEWIFSSEQRQIEMAAALLSEAPSTFVWSHSEYIANILTQANKHSPKTYDRVTSSLLTSVVQGVRSGIPGQPFPEDIAQRDRSKEMMEKLTIGSPVYRFYRYLYDGAVGKIKRDALIDFEE